MGLLLATGALKKKEPEPPPPRDAYREGHATLEAETRLAPEQFALDKSNLTNYMGLEGDLLAQMQDRLGPVVDRQAAQAASAQRAGDISDVEMYGPRAIAAFKSASPEQAALLDEFNRQALEDLKAGTTLTPSMQREIEQYTRQGQSARGMGLGPVDVSQEASTLGSAGQQLQAQRRAFAGNVLGMNQSVSNIPFMSVLGRTAVASPITAGLTQQGSAQGQQQAGSMNPFTNAYAADVNNTNFNANWTDKISTRNYNAAVTGALIGAIGSIVGGAAGGAAGGA